MNEKFSFVACEKCGGREAVTTKPWHHREISPHFRDRPPDNAEFVCRRESGRGV